MRTDFETFQQLSGLDEWEAALEKHGRWHHTPDLRPLFAEKPTVKISLHNGTWEAREILDWMSLWMRILKIAEGDESIPEGSGDVRKLPLTRGPEGDIIELAKLVSVSAEMRESLLHRRQYVLDTSWATNPEYADVIQDLYEYWGVV